jgi:hypothetical protein
MPKTRQQCYEIPTVHIALAIRRAVWRKGRTEETQAPTRLLRRIIRGFQRNRLDRVSRTWVTLRAVPARRPLHAWSSSPLVHGSVARPS